MELVFIIAILAPCALVALLILATAIRPSAAPALAMVLAAIAEPLRVITHRSRAEASLPESRKSLDSFE